MQNISRIIIASALAIMAQLTVMANERPKGVGCWRTIPKTHAATARMMSQERVEAGERTHYVGVKHGLVILAQFLDTKFQKANDRTKYINILNAEGYTTKEGFKGSVQDYFRAQSGGQFELVFDVVGPFTAKYKAKNYGANNSHGSDEQPEALIVEMCNAANSKVNFADYDWDGDGEVDEVFVVYAGKGEADSGTEDLIWPHMWTFDEAGVKLELDGVKINTYACANELKGGGGINGIGTFCHEFSHCMGLPDFYDINYSGEFGMSEFDLMSGGSYAGGSFCPVGYTAYEKMMCGWQEPIVLANEDVSIDSLKPMNDQGDTYIIYNDGYPNEFYMIENRQQKGWDKYYPAKGLLISHVDFDKQVWIDNIPNSIMTWEDARKKNLKTDNNHQRMTLFHADNDDDAAYWNPYGGYYNKSTLSTDLYPYLENDSLTMTSVPAATLFHNNALGQKFMRGAILDIRQNSDGTMAFRYRAPQQQDVDAIREVDSPTPAYKDIYTMDGRKVTTDWQSLPHGLYIVDGRKRIK